MLIRVKGFRLEFVILGFFGKFGKYRNFILFWVIIYISSLKKINKLYYRCYW